MLDLKTVEFKEQLAGLINNCGLPLILVDFVLKEFSQEVQLVLNRTLQMQREEKVKNDDLSNDNEESN
jgi:hypothetical protein